MLLERPSEYLQCGCSTWTTWHPHQPDCSGRNSLSHEAHCFYAPEDLRDGPLVPVWL